MTTCDRATASSSDIPEHIPRIFGLTRSSIADAAAEIEVNVIFNVSKDVVVDLGYILHPWLPRTVAGVAGANEGDGVIQLGGQCLGRRVGNKVGWLADG